jgi:CRISPR-associated exonuclease Cas4
MPDGHNGLFTVTDLKQFQYCPRILFYHSCLPDVRPVTYKMEAGIRRHQDEPKRAIRRNMRLPEIQEARREFDVLVQSDSLGLSGQIDELLFFEDSLVPVDYKLAKQAGAHFKLQVVAYGMMVEEVYQLPVFRGIIYLTQKREVIEVPLGKNLREQVRTAVKTMRQIVEDERMPEPTPNRKACLDCEFRRFCNDV